MALPRAKHEKKKPWWHNPPISAITVSKELIERLKLHSTLVEQMREAVAGNQYYSRPYAKRKWQEIVIVENVKLSLICHVEGNLIVIREIKRAQKKGFD
jgi:hypothetical protein